MKKVIFLREERSSGRREKLDVSPDCQESYPSTVLFINCHGVALFMDGLQNDITVYTISI
jgi:hypothetical protein